ncbi:ribosomal protein S2, flavodoxin-like domain-containing protein [Fennellomyces sp. T-0311]|nr:ribosomal protein S2, flavodoxin-like domain-containing protein [Fennellomyces sp. T-0311]
MASRTLFKNAVSCTGRIAHIPPKTSLRAFSVVKPLRQEPAATSEQSNAAEALKDLVPPADATVKKPIWRSLAESAESITPYNLSIGRLLAAGLHLGHSTSLWEPATLPFIFGTREGISIINLEHTLVYLRRACNVAREVAYRGGNILFVGTRPGFQDLTVDAARRCEGYHVSGKWIPGTLTNAQQVLGRHATPDPNDPGRVPQTFKPDLIVLLNPLENRIAIQEAQLNMIPVIAITDTDYDPRRVTYPIPANDDSIRGVELVAKVISTAAKDGLLQRKQLLDKKHKETRFARREQ